MTEMCWGLRKRSSPGTGNYATIDHITSDIVNKYPDGEVGVVFPILSRNRFQ